MQQDKLRAHFKSLSEQELVDFIKKTSQTLARELKKKTTACNATLDAPARSGARGGKHTTLQANAQRAAEAYEGTKEMLKLAIAELL